ncbi:glucose dehydrogenase [FAD, quinone]-like [Bactrocera neohumeralis]|uniref:glucose dehydrogenase [FAD, quinone]-like n=1 Tax=Bactrocera neohumeralis TaxID=98809 RepID=UPI0021659BD4|nr:glucose dehydrogenase [FAD, quinone]-like [Bactrocera neohumeralis]
MEFVSLALTFVALCLNSTAANTILDNIFQLGLANVIEQFNTPTPQHNAAYDFIIVGGGAAGCTLANRLSENPNWSVVLLEAGGVENIAHRIPITAGFLQGTHSNWGYKSVPQKLACFGMNNNECALPRGKILGGTSSINYMIYNRGNRRDYDGWAAAGSKGWSYDEVLPYFLKSENAQLSGLEWSPYHNHSGPLNVEDVGYRTQFSHAFVRGAQQAGHPYTDYNGESQVGVSYVQATTQNGRRHSAYRAFIRPVRRVRRNLSIFTFAQVLRVLVDPQTKVAYGVEFLHQKKQYIFKAHKEVILSAGAFNSPQLLMLSGIGPADNLNAIGIPVIQELPVGKRMYDHMSHIGPVFLTNTTGQTTYPTSITLSDIKRFFLFGDRNTRLSSIGGVECLAFVKIPSSQRPSDWPDVELITVLGGMASDDGTGLKEGGNIRQDLYDQLYLPLQLARQEHFTVLIMDFHPRSVGRLWLHNRDPLRWPIIDPKYFSNEEDIEHLLEGIKAAIRIGETPAMKRIGARLYDKPVPGCENYLFGSDDYWRCSIRTLSYTLHHQVATCRMGSPTDDTTVVDPQLKVHGIRKLRIVDTSIIPFPPTAHTNAPAFMIGEKAADLIRAEWEANFWLQN